MAINITCDTKEEAEFIGEAMNVYQAEAGPVPFLNPNNTTVSVGDDKYTEWYMDDEGDIPWDFYGLDEPDDEDEEED